MNSYTKDELKALSRADLSVFSARVLRMMLPDYQHFPYIDLILLKIGYAMLRNGGWRILINLPPRHLKTFMVICAIAWFLGRNPTKEVMLVTHSQGLSRDIAWKVETVMNSAIFLSTFPECRVSEDRRSAMDFRTTLGGGFYAGSFDSRMTGRGADLLVMDDPISAQEASSPAARDAVELSYQTMIKTRHNDPRTGATLMVAHRTHPDDLSEFLMKEGFDRVVLQLEAEEDEEVHFGNFHFSRKKGEVLQPTIYTPDALARLKRETASHVFATQYQQRPVSLQGGLLKRSDFPIVPSLPTGGKIVVSWDVASSSNPRSSFTVALVFVRHQHVSYLVHILRERLDYSNLVRRAADLHLRYGPTHHLVESASLGPALIADLRNLGANVLSISATTSKVDRVNAIMNQFNNQEIQLVQGTPGLDLFLDELVSFPHGSNDDQVDALTQYSSWNTQDLPEPERTFKRMGPPRSKRGLGFRL
ncbi:hypothetical protein [Mesorhizobium shangrilense]|uniref:Terminase large subunit gp17-like C-terminal domain-containing protein n=1 Tax=Mesorhizobium shangrilense TaxID=460060 RepID=A0ABV2DGZ2_9HYPH